MSTGGLMERHDFVRFTPSAGHGPRTAVSCEEDRRTRDALHPGLKKSVAPWRKPPSPSTCSIHPATNQPHRHALTPRRRPGQSLTSIPMFAQVPITVFIADWSLLVFRSGSFTFAISST